MDKRRREAIRVLVSEARTRALEATEAGRYRGRSSPLRPSIRYRYELHRGDEPVRIGHLARARAVRLNERMMVDGMVGIVRRIDAAEEGRPASLVVELAHEGMDDRSERHEVQPRAA